MSHISMTTSTIRAMAKILVTNAGGVLGKLIIRELARRGHSITAVPEKGQDIIICCGMAVQQAKDIVKAARQAKAKHIILISSLWASPRSRSRRLVTHYETELIVRQSTIPHTILRPGAIIRKGSRLGPAFPLPKPLSRRGIQPTYLDDLVGSIAAAVDTGPKNATHEIPGPEKLTLREFLGLLAEALRARLITAS